MDGYRFATDLTVRFNETDAQGVVHNAVYLVWFEIARVAYLGQFPGGYKGLVEQGVDATTIEASVRYRGGASTTNCASTSARPTCAAPASASSTSSSASATRRESWPTAGRGTPA